MPLVLVLQMPAHTYVDKTEQDEIHNSQIWWRSYWSKSTKYILSFTIIQYFNPFKQNSSWEPLFYFNLKNHQLWATDNNNKTNYEHLTVKINNELFQIIGNYN